MEKLRSCLKKLCASKKKEQKVTPLPKGLLAVLYALLLFNAMTMTTVFSYLPKFVKSIGTSEIDTGYYAGLIASSLFIGRLLFSIVWGYIADQKGKKFAAITSASGLMVSTLAFGFSSNFAWAFVTRLLQGCFMGLIVACKSILNDRCDDSNFALGMSIMISAFSAGLVIGPSCAGFLVFPAEQYPNIFSKDNIFTKYGILLPNFIIFVGFIVTILVGIKMIPQDKRKKKVGEKSFLLDPLKETQNYDGNQQQVEVASFKRKNPETYLTVSIKDTIVNDDDKSLHYFQIIEPVVGISSNLPHGTIKDRWRKSKAKQLFSNKSCVVSCVLYGTYSLVAIGFDEMVPLYLATSRTYSGMEFTPADIGLALLIVALILIFLQITMLTSLTRKYGSKYVLIGSLFVMAFFFPLLPSIQVIKNVKLMWAVLVCHLLICRVSLAGAFLAINILVNNSVGSNLVGSANGLAMSLSSGGRMIAPTMFGSVYSWSLSNVKNVEGNENPIGFPFNQYFPFLVLSFGAILNAIAASKIPRTLDRQTQEEEIEDENSHNSNVTNITISYFTPTNR